MISLTLDKRLALSLLLALFFTQNSFAGDLVKFQQLLRESFPKLESARIFSNKKQVGHIEDIQLGEKPAFLLEIGQSRSSVELKDDFLHLEEVSLVKEAQHKSQYPLKALLLERFGQFLIDYSNPQKAAAAGLGPLSDYEMAYTYKQQMHNYHFESKSTLSLLKTVEFRFYTNKQNKTRLVGLILYFGPEKEYLINF